MTDLYHKGDPLRFRDKVKSLIFRKAYEVKPQKIPAPFERYIKTLIGPETGAKMFEMGLSLVPPGSSTGLHEHGDSEEAAYVISGRGVAYVGSKDKTVEIEPEMVLFFPPHFKHGLVNRGEETLKILWVSSPPRGLAKSMEKIGK